jgi:hypothetical protein
VPVDLPAVVRAQQHKVGMAATIIMLVLIARLTLYPAPGPLPSGFHSCVLCGTYGVADFIDNIILFVPLGAALRLAGLRRRTAWLVMLALAAGIETAQDWIISGRESSLSDLISNPLGGAIGIALTDLRGVLLAPRIDVARRLAAAAALAVVVVAAAVTWSLGLAIPRTGTYWAQVGSRLPQYVPFDGEILSPAIDGQPTDNGRVDSTTGAAMRLALRGGTARIDARVVPRIATLRLAPLITLYDQWRNEILVLGCRRGRAVFRLRTRSEPLRLHPVSFEAADGCAVGDTTVINAEPLAGGALVRLETARAGHRTVTTQGIGPWLGWHLLVPDDGWWSGLDTVFTILWMAGLIGPMAYWRARADRMGGNRRVPAGFVGAIAAVVAATLVVIPLIADSHPAPAIAWLGATVGAAVGWLGAQWNN